MIKSSILQYSTASILCAAGVLFADENNYNFSGAGPSVTHLTELNVQPYLDRATTNFYESLPAFLTVTNGVLQFGVTNEILWTSSEAHDWGSWLPTGQRNPSAEESVTINKKLAILPEKHYWQSAGTFYVLAADNATLTAESNGSSVTWTFADGSRMMWKSGSSALVGAQASGITTDAAHVFIDYAAGSDAATLTVMRADTADGIYEPVTNVVWTQVDAATRRAAVPMDGKDSGFFRAQTFETYPAYILHESAVKFDGGIMTSGQDANPVVYNATVEIEVGGHTYRLPAQLVE